MISNKAKDTCNNLYSWRTFLCGSFFEWS